MPIRRGDGTEIESIRKGDGTQIAEVRKGDGTVLWQRNAIPDSGDLHSAYDARQLSLSDGQTVSTWSDTTGNGYDLSATGAPTYQTGVINSNPAVGTDGVDDVLSAAYSTISQPLTLFMTVRFPTLNTLRSHINSEDPATDDVRFGAGNDGGNRWRIFAGTDNERGGTPSATTNYVLTLLLDGSNTEVRLNGSLNFNAGDPGPDGLAGLSIGGNVDTSEYGEGQFGQVLVYPLDKSSRYAEIEGYLGNEWGITI